MGYINQTPNLRDMFQDIEARLRKLETAQRFTVPVVTTDPTNPRKGDMWINSTTNVLKIVDSSGTAGTVRTITWV